jgi:subtilase family serine protease
VSFPAASRYVTAVGGTVLSRGGGGSRGWTETTWSGAGSGCSLYESKRTWQKDTGCTNRTVADVSAVALNVAVYDTYQEPGWIVVGGTSVSAPVIASVYALAGGKAHYGSDPYLNPPHLFDITTGSNGSCMPKYLCTAGPGYDGPTGLGTPDGVKSFI